MRLVTIAARHALVEHPALDERSIFIDLALDLSIGVVKILIEQRHPIVVSHWLTVNVVFVNLAAPRMTTRAHLDFSLRGAWRATFRIAGGRIYRPRNSFALVESDS